MPATWRPTGGTGGATWSSRVVGHEDPGEGAYPFPTSDHRLVRVDLQVKA